MVVQPGNVPQNNGWVDLGSMQQVPGGFPPGHNVKNLTISSLCLIDAAANDESELKLVKLAVDFESQSDSRAPQVLPLDSNQSVKLISRGIQSAS